MCIIGLLIFAQPGIGQESPVTCYDMFYNAFHNQKEPITDLFTDQGRITTVYYDSLGEADLVSFSPIEYQNQLNSIANAYRVKRVPRVLIVRQYGGMASIYSTVTVNLSDKSTGEKLTNNTIQSMQLAKVKGQWKIKHISIQSEHPSYPIDPKLMVKWSPPTQPNSPERIQNEPDITLSPIPDFSSEYDSTQVFRIEEVDEPPTYPSGEENLEKLKQTYNIIEVPNYGYTPFIVTIMEDGQAKLTYTHDLSGYQIAQAQSFVRSMMIWYPAIKYAASVKCKLYFYIRD